MSFREKSAWISFVLILIFGGLWLRNVIQVEFYGMRQNPMHFFFGMLAALIAAEIALHVAIALQSPGEARTHKDERERLIDFRASRVAFYVLMVGAWTSISTLHLPNSSRFLMAQFLMGSIIIAVLTRFATQIVLYRRDA
jgi:hypothetical protein